MKTGPSHDGMHLCIPETPFEVELIRRVLSEMTSGTNLLGVTCAVGDATDREGYYYLTAQAPRDNIPAPDVLSPLERALGRGPTIHGQVALLEREEPASEHYRMALAWEYEDDAEYWGGDGPIVNATFIFRCTVGLGCL